MPPIVAMHTVIVFRPGKRVDTVKLCKKCRYYEPVYERCKLFGNMNVVNGNIEYNYAAAERREEGECGPDAKYWDNIIGDKTAPAAATPAATQSTNLTTYENTYNHYKITHWD